LEPQVVTDHPESRWRTHWRMSIENSPGLQVVVERWDELSTPIRVGILAMIRAATR